MLVRDNGGDEEKIKGEIETAKYKEYKPPTEKEWFNKTNPTKDYETDWVINDQIHYKKASQKLSPNYIEFINFVAKKINIPATNLEFDEEKMGEFDGKTLPTMMGDDFTVYVKDPGVLPEETVTIEVTTTDTGANPNTGIDSKSKYVGDDAYNNLKQFIIDNGLMGVGNTIATISELTGDHSTEISNDMVKQKASAGTIKVHVEIQGPKPVVISGAKLPNPQNLPAVDLPVVTAKIKIQFKYGLINKPPIDVTNRNDYTIDELRQEAINAIGDSGKTDGGKVIFKKNDGSKIDDDITLKSLIQSTTTNDTLQLLIEYNEGGTPVIDDKIKVLFKYKETSNEITIKKDKFAGKTNDETLDTLKIYVLSTVMVDTTKVKEKVTIKKGDGSDIGDIDALIQSTDKDGTLTLLIEYEEEIKIEFTYKSNTHALGSLTKKKDYTDKDQALIAIKTYTKTLFNDIDDSGIITIKQSDGSDIDDIAKLIQDTTPGSTLNLLIEYDDMLTIKLTYGGTEKLNKQVSKGEYSVQNLKSDAVAVIGDASKGDPDKVIFKKMNDTDIDNIATLLGSVQVGDTLELKIDYNAAAPPPPKITIKLTYAGVNTTKQVNKNEYSVQNLKDEAFAAIGDTSKNKDKVIFKKMDGTDVTDTLDAVLTGVTDGGTLDLKIEYNDDDGGGAGTPTNTTEVTVKIDKINSRRKDYYTNRGLTPEFDSFKIHLNPDCVPTNCAKEIEKVVKKVETEYSKLLPKSTTTPSPDFGDLNTVILFINGTSYDTNNTTDMIPLNVVTKEAIQSKSLTIEIETKIKPTLPAPPGASPPGLPGAPPIGLPVTPLGASPTVTTHDLDYYKGYDRFYRTIRDITNDFYNNIMKYMNIYNTNNSEQSQKVSNSMWMLNLLTGIPFDSTKKLLRFYSKFKKDIEVVGDENKFKKYNKGEPEFLVDVPKYSTLDGTKKQAIKTKRTAQQTGGASVALTTIDEAVEHLIEKVDIKNLDKEGIFSRFIISDKLKLINYKLQLLVRDYYKYVVQLQDKIKDNCSDTLQIYDDGTNMFFTIKLNIGSEGYIYDIYNNELTKEGEWTLTLTDADQGIHRAILNEIDLINIHYTKNGKDGTKITDDQKDALIKTIIDLSGYYKIIVLIQDIITKLSDEGKDIIDRIQLLKQLYGISNKTFGFGFDASKFRLELDSASRHETLNNIAKQSGFLTTGTGTSIEDKLTDSKLLRTDKFDLELPAGPAAYTAPVGALGVAPVAPGAAPVAAPVAAPGAAPVAAVDTYKQKLRVEIKKIKDAKSTELSGIIIPDKLNESLIQLGKFVYDGV